MNKMQKVFAAIVAIVFLTAAFFSLEFVAGHTHHQCQGEDCPVCAQLEAAAHMLRNLGAALGLTTLITFLYLSTKIYVVSYETFCVKNTLISLKQELLN